MEFSIVFQSILNITILILIGVLLSKTFSFNDETRKMFINIIVNIAMPCMILSSIFKVDLNDGIFKSILIVFCLSILINLLGIALGWILSITFQGDSTKKREIALMSGLGTTGFIGIPLCATLIGPEAALYAAIFDAGVDFTIWTVGVIMLQKNRRFALQTLKSMVNMPTAAIVVGLIVAYFSIKPPAFFVHITDQLAGLATPLAMFYIGMLIMTLQRGKVREKGHQLWIPLMVKLILLPFSVALLIHFFELNPKIIQTLLIQSMMPTLTIASILFAKYSADAEMGALTTIISTIISLSTIPLMLFLINFIGVF
ncbi:AEC family transporter [Bacillus salipaludis]|uniref:AEC family transporter n=1 Tax=Bacillus salipaludis TaxID=2547811 RepID=A0A4R5VSY5_9BACI|nr:AEC family transporter [Bacillus salipaludis]TDK60960.1 AEC family transporter [Bacillus salipaludis]